MDIKTKTEVNVNLSKSQVEEALFMYVINKHPDLNSYVCKVNISIDLNSTLELEEANLIFTKDEKNS